MKANGKTAVIALLLVTGAALRFAGLGRAVLTESEAGTLLTAAMEKRTLVEIYKAGGERFLPGPFHYLTATGRLTGPTASELEVRFAAALFGVAALMMIFLAARRLAGADAAIWALAFAALSPYLIQFSRELSWHSLAFLFYAAALWTLTCAIDKEKPKMWIIFHGLTLVVCASLFPPLLCIVAPLNAVFLTHGPRKSRTLWLIVNAAAVAAGLFFLFGWLPSATGKPLYAFGFAEHVDKRFIPVTKFILFQGLELYAQVFGAAGGFMILHNVFPSLFQAAAFLLIPFVFHAALLYGLKPYPGEERLRLTIFLLLAFTLPVSVFLLFLGFSLGESLIAFLPVLPIALSVGLTRYGSRKFKIVFAALLVCAAAGSLPDVYRAERERIPWRNVVELIEKKSQPGDKIVFLDGRLAGPFLYYAPEKIDRMTVGFFPDFSGRIIGEKFMQELVAAPFNPMFDSTPPFTVAGLFDEHDAIWILYKEKFPDKNNRISTSTYWLLDRTRAVVENEYRSCRGEGMKLKDEDRCVTLLKAERLTPAFGSDESPYHYRPPR